MSAGVHKIRSLSQTLAIYGSRGMLQFRLWKYLWSLGGISAKSGEWDLLSVFLHVVLACFCLKWNLMESHIL